MESVDGDVDVHVKIHAPIDSEIYRNLFDAEFQYAILWVR